MKFNNSSKKLTILQTFERFTQTSNKQFAYQPDPGSLHKQFQHHKQMKLCIQCYIDNKTIVLCSKLQALMYEQTNAPT
jgi:hypothetical protein